MPGERMYCPMCGEAFRLGAERCARCAAPLPAAGPNLEAMERAAHARSEGAALAWSCLRRGFRLLRLRPALLVLPLLFVVVGAVRSYTFEQAMIARAAFGRAGGAFPRRGLPAGLPARLAANLWLQQQLDGSRIASEAAHAGARMCAPVPGTGLAHYAVYQSAFPTGALAGRDLAAAWADALVMVAANALLWLLMWRAVAADSGRARAGGAPWRDARLLAVVLAISALGIANMAAVGARGWMPYRSDLMTLIALVGMALVTAGCAVVAAQGTGDSAGALWARTLFSAEGVLYVALSVVLLLCLRYATELAAMVGLGGGYSGPSTPISILAAVAAGLTAWLATGTALGFFFLLDRHVVQTRAADAAGDRGMEVAAR